MKGPVTKNSTIGEIYSTAVGHDAINRILLQLGISEKWVTNPFVSGLRFGTILRLAGKRIPPSMGDAVLSLINAESENDFKADGEMTHTWWKEAVFYQIYPSSFCDGNGDGTGDIKGITSKLDYLRDLGVGALWLSPVYDSPWDDNGYDIRDYRKILPAFGTMEDFDELLREVHARGMRLIMDLVVNHTSDEHAWFREALADPGSKYRSYYFFRPGNGGGKAPNNWTSFFSGSAWNYYPEQDLWALHLFSQKQMDLNWEEPAVRDDVVRMVNWWLDKGVDGFRMDVINYISKEPGLPDGDEAVGGMMGYMGIEKYFYGPKLHEYLRELHEKAFAPHGAFSVGETPGIGRRMAQLVTAQERGELDMIFSFDHLESPGHKRFDDYRYDLNYYRDFITDWMLHYGSSCRMSLFYNNHDNPRMISKIDPDPARHAMIAVLLAVMQFTLRGTPFVYQGDEMGLANVDFHSIDEITDVESRNLYAELTQERGMSAQEAFATILAGTRDHTRQPLPWNYGNGAIDPPAHLRQKPLADVTEAYRWLIAFRKAHKESLIYGEFRPLIRRKGVFVYERSGADGTFVVECNLSDRERKTGFDPGGYTPVFIRSGAKQITDGSADLRLPAMLVPYEVRIWDRGQTSAAHP